MERDRDEPRHTEFDGIKISIASPETIRSWSHGEVTRPSTLDYCTLKPEPDGLLCAKIFGPIVDRECRCGAYRGTEHRGVVCEECGIEVARSRVRRERMGHIELAAPVAHVWFSRSWPSPIGLVLGLSTRALERILYFESYVVVEPGDTELTEGELLTEERYHEVRDEYGEDAFDARMGAESIRELLSRIDIDELAEELRITMKTETSQIRRLKAAKRLAVVDALRRSDQRPEWMILDVLPVLPAGLRPPRLTVSRRLVTGDLNDLYARVLYRNRRLAGRLEVGAPEAVVRHEKRRLQEAVDALLDNGRRARVLAGSSNRRLKSLSDALKGKRGRFRRHLLGKRVDYSGRAVIVAGPELQIHQCGLPRKMALELFRPFVYGVLRKRGLADSLEAAREMVAREEEAVWASLEEVVRDHPVLLNRAPTLHRLGIQAFEPVLIEGKAIRIPPLMSAAFNTEFGGDQMAVHVPLSPKARVESRALMLASNNLLSPAHGRPLVVPSREMVEGTRYLTSRDDRTEGGPRVFRDFDSVMLALHEGVVGILSEVRVRYSGGLVRLESDGDLRDALHGDVDQIDHEPIETTVGRVIFNMSLPEQIPYVDGVLDEKRLEDLVGYCCVEHGSALTARMLEGIQEISLEYATRAGTLPGIEDVTASSRKALSAADFFISAQGARRSPAEAELGSALRLLLSRRLVDVALDVVVSEEDCGTTDGLEVSPIEKSGEILESLRDRIVGRVSQEAIYDPNGGDMLVDVGQELSEAIANNIQSAGIEGVTIRSVLTCESRGGVCQRCYGRNLVSGTLVEVGEPVGVIAAQAIGGAGVTGIPPRVVELFEARRPKEPAIISEIDGTVRLGGIQKGMRKVTVENEAWEVRDYQVPPSVHVNVQEGERVTAGEPLIDGSINPHEILRVLGEKELQRYYLLDEIQRLYRSRGAEFDDKHVEVILRQMMLSVKIEEVNDTDFLIDEQVDRWRFCEENQRVIAAGGAPAIGRPILQGITRASLAAEGFISVASVLGATRVLAWAAIQGRVDRLRGRKERLVVGLRIPTGRGMSGKG